MSEPYLVAHVVNATSAERAQVVYDVAYRNEDDDWHTISGWQVWPFGWQPLDAIELAPGFARGMPLGWIEHLQELARHQAAAQPKPPDLAAMFTAPKVPPGFKRRA